MPPGKAASNERTPDNNTGHETRKMGRSEEKRRRGNFGVVRVEFKGIKKQEHSKSF